MSTLTIGCTARVLDVPGGMQFAGRLVEVKHLALEHACKNFEGEGAYAWAPGFGWWFPVECLEWVSDAPPVWPPRYDEDEDGCEDCEDLRAEIARLKALLGMARDGLERAYPFVCDWLRAGIPETPGGRKEHARTVSTEVAGTAGAIMDLGIQKRAFTQAPEGQGDTP